MASIGEIEELPPSPRESTSDNTRKEITPLEIEGPPNNATVRLTPPHNEGSRAIINAIVSTVIFLFNIIDRYSMLKKKRFIVISYMSVYDIICTNT